MFLDRTIQFGFAQKFVQNQTYVVNQKEGCFLLQQMKSIDFSAF